MKGLRSPIRWQILFPPGSWYPKRLSHYALAIGLAYLALAAKQVLTPALENHSMYGTFFAATVIAAYISGPGPAACTALCGGLLADYYLLPPAETFTFWQREHAAALAIYLFISAVFIAAIHKLQGALRAAADERERWKAVVNSIPDEVWVSDGTGKMTLINSTTPAERALTAAGKSADSAQQTLTQARRPRPLAQHPLLLALSGKVVRGGEILLDSKTGGERHRRYSASPIRDASGNITGSVAVFRDTTDIHEVEESARRQALLVDLSHDAILTLDTKRRILSWNRGAEEMYGWTPDEAKGQILQDLLHTTGPMGTEELDDLLRTRGRWEGKLHHTTKNGSALIVESRQVMQTDQYGLAAGILEINRDITMRDRAENALRESEQKYRIVADNTDSWEFWLGPNGRFLYTSPSCKQITGRDPAEFIAQPNLLDRIVHPEDRKRYVVHRTSRDQTCSAAEMEFRIVRPDGSVRWLSHSCRPLADERGNYFGIRGSNRDITDRKEAEQALLESEHRLRATFENIPIGIIETDPGGRCLAVNDRLCAILSRPRQEILGCGFRDLLAPDEQNRSDALTAAIIGGTQQTGRLEARMARGADETLWVNLTMSALRDAEQRLVRLLITVEDYTDRKLAEEEHLRFEAQVQQAQKLESLGLLAGGIAHDFNNLLTGVFGSIEIARLHVSAGNSAKALPALQTALTSFQRAKGLTRQLITFAKGGSPVKKTIDISNLVRDTAEFTLSGSNVRKVLQLAPGLWPCEIDEGQISQAIDNVIINAKQAMLHGGTLTISAENTIAGSNQREQHLPEGRYVRLSIHDTGPGIPAEHLSKIFDPFFTTKDTGHGLGLSVVYSIVKKHGGFVAVDSKPGAGSTFHIFLPASGDAPAMAENHAAPPPSKFGGRILIMDDEISVAQVAAQMLEQMGYSTSYAPNGDQAVRLYSEALLRESPFDAVILDLTVPGGLGGEGTLRQLREIDPNVRAIICSGYADDKIMENPASFGFQGTIVKPYLPSELDQALQRVLHIVQLNRAQIRRRAGTAA